MPHKDIHAGGLIHKYFDNKQLDGLYLSTAVKHFAGSFISIFIPIYLLTLGFTLSNIALYYLVTFVSAFIIFPLGMKLNSKIGMKKVMSLGILVLIIYYLLLNSLSSGNINYLFIALVSGISTAFYWAGFHMEFSKFCDKKKEARETSLINIFSKVAGAIGPILGAILIIQTSFNFLFVLSSILLIVSIIPLFTTKDEKTTYNFSLKKILFADTKRKAIAYEASAILGLATGIFWPIFIFLTLKEVVSLGAIVSITAVVEIVFLFYVGKFSDKHKRKTLKGGIFLHSFSWIARISFLTPIGIFFNNVYSSLSSTLVDLPFAKIIYSKSKKVNDASDYFLFREFHLTIGRIIVLSIIFLTANIYWLFIASFFVTFVYFVLLRKDK